MDKRIDVIAVTLLGLMIVLVRLYDVYTVYDDVS